MIRRVFFVIIAVSVVFFAFSAHAQVSAQPKSQLVVSWHASRSFIPTFYQGKALPNQSSEVTASVEAFTNGARGDLSNVTVYWYLNGVLLGGGPGVRSMTFNLFSDGGASQELRVQATDYAAGLLTSSVSLSPLTPTVVIDAPYMGGNFSVNPLAVSAVPYFFNITSVNQLGFVWSVNDQTISNTENPNQLRATLAAGARAGSTVSVAVVAKNSSGVMATDQKTFTYQPLP